MTLIDQITRLTLLTDLHRARRTHKPTAAIMARLRAVTARAAVSEGQG